MTTPRPVVVMLHGVGLDHTVWAAVRPLLDAAYDVRCLDLPGHGGGPRVGEDVDLAGLAGLVAAEVPAHSHLVGFSLGALVAQHLAVHRPDLVASLTSVSSVCRRTAEERTAVLARLATAEADFEVSVEASLRRWFDGTEVAEDVVAQTRQVLLGNDVEQFLRCYRVFATGDSDVAPHLHRIEVPALAITGSADRGSTPAMTHRLAQLVPGCRAEVLDGVRHMLPLEAPDELARSLNDFIGGRVHA